MTMRVEEVGDIIHSALFNPFDTWPFQANTSATF